MRPPAQLYKKSDRIYDRSPDDIDYGTMRHLKISPQGTITWRRQWVFISSALAGWSVGLKPCAAGKHNVWFGRLLLGEFDETTLTFQSSAPEPKCKQAN